MLTSVACACAMCCELFGVCLTPRGGRTPRPYFFFAFLFTRTVLSHLCIALAHTPRVSAVQARRVSRGLGSKEKKARNPTFFSFPSSLGSFDSQ